MIYLYYIIDIASMYLNILVSLNHLRGSYQTIQFEKNDGTGRKENNYMYIYFVA